MDTLLKRKERLIRTTYVLGLIFSIHLALLTYINSTFLASFFSESSVGLIYTIGSLAAVFGFVFIPDILRRYGNYRVALVFVLLTTLVVLGLVVNKIAFLAALLIGFYILLSRLVGFNADIFLESASEDRETGRIRGTFFTLVNTAFVISPFIAGLLLQDSNFGRVYLVSAGVLLLLIPLLTTRFSSFVDPKYDRVPFWRTLREVFRRQNIHKVLMVNFLLHLFYAWMVIYVPIYLRNHIGFEWSQIGLIFTIMLLPFVLVGYPLGKIADTRLGEKEIMSAGFIILAIATAIISFIFKPDFAIWAIALFATRVGASTVAIMTETYFFKQIDGTDSNIIGFFRMVQPLAYVVGPLLASLLLLFIDIRYLFVVLGIIMLYGLRYSLTLKDTL